MNTYFEGGVSIEWFRDYCQFSEHVESEWIKFSQQIIFSDKIHKISDLYYYEFQAEVILFLEDLEQNYYVIYFELMTKSKLNYFMTIIQNHRPCLNINSLNDNFKGYFD